jgi:hypothetical protein
MAMKKEKMLHLKKIKIASLVTLLNDEEKKIINGGTKMTPGTTFIRIFC